MGDLSEAIIWDCYHEVFIGDDDTFIEEASQDIQTLFFKLKFKAQCEKTKMVEKRLLKVEKIVGVILKAMNLDKEAILNKQ